MVSTYFLNTGEINLTGTHRKFVVEKLVFILNNLTTRGCAAIMRCVINAQREEVTPLQSR